MENFGRALHRQGRRSIQVQFLNRRRGQFRGATGGGNPSRLVGATLSPWWGRPWWGNPGGGNPGGGNPGGGNPGGGNPGGGNPGGQPSGAGNLVGATLTGQPWWGQPWRADSGNPGGGNPGGGNPGRGKVRYKHIYIYMSGPWRGLFMENFGRALHRQGRRSI